MEQIRKGCQYSNTCVGCKWLYTDNDYDDSVVGCTAPKSLTSKNTTMDKKKFGYIFTAGMCMLPTIILFIVWAASGFNVVEPTMFQEAAKWVFMDAALTLFIALPFGYILAPFVWHCIYDKKGKDSGSQD